MLSYPAMIPLSSRTLNHLADRIAATVNSADPGGGASTPAGRRCSLSPIYATATPTPAAAGRLVWASPACPVRPMT